MKYEHVLEYLKKASVKGSVLGLSRIKKLLELLMNPQEKLKVVHVSGTNGKGSFSAMLSSVLKEAGYSVGVFSSPSLVRVNDCFRLDCKAVSDEVFADTLNKVIEKADRMPDSPTEFELLTAAAFEMFYKCGCDICIIECGLGGDTDSTNVLEKPVLSVITNVQKDHCGILGNSLAEIAAHKAGIIKRNCPVLYGGERNEAFDVIENKAMTMSARLYVTDTNRISDENFSVNGTVFSFGKYRDIRLSLLGSYQTVNAANVLTAVEILHGQGMTISDNAVFRGLEKTVWEGRFEIIRKNPPVIFDGAHNPCGMQEAVKTVKKCFGGQRTVLLMGVMEDKEYSLYPDMLRDIADVVFTVTPDNPRSLSADALAGFLSGNGINARASDNFSDGLMRALQYSEKNKLPLLVLGSLYMYREFKESCKGLL
ncbi:MAG: bifunctional folylpolyglutamate synthase/dihydrofolate synthase [Ruminococcus sp.]|nr:bifunctional folylpolyglutamate synthase/dihydrofolate synthase [Ruminococcus sp.]